MPHLSLTSCRSAVCRLLFAQKGGKKMNINMRASFAITSVLLSCLCEPGAISAAAPPPQAGVPTLAPLVERVTPAVVNIAVLSRSPEQDNPMLQDPFYRRLPERSQPQISAGSGVIVNAGLGHVLTNQHVVKD